MANNLSNLDASQVMRSIYDPDSNSLRSVDTSALVPEAYDYISLSYTGSDLTTVVYKSGGASGTVVATLTLTYLANVLQTITRT